MISDFAADGESRQVCSDSLQTVSDDCIEMVAVRHIIVYTVGVDHVTVASTALWV